MLAVLAEPVLIAPRIRARGCIRKSAHREKSRPCLAASGRRRVQVRGVHREICHLATMSRRVTVLPQEKKSCSLSRPTGIYWTTGGVDARFDSDTAARLSTALANLNRQGINPVITSGYRSPDAQSRLRASDSLFVITPAAVSWHQVGAAVDIGPNTNAGNFNAIRSAMSQAGFVWGGNFRTPDRPHFQSQPAGTSPSSELVQSCLAAAGGG